MAQINLPLSKDQFDNFSEQYNSALKKYPNKDISITFKTKLSDNSGAIFGFFIYPFKDGKPKD